MGRMIHHLSCVRCGSPFTAKLRRAKFCSNVCRQREFEDRKAAGIVGAEELIPPGLDTSWKQRGDCLHSSVDFFDPDQYRQAKAICAECPVVWDCLDYALKSRSYFGMWGGLTPSERRLLPVRRSA